MAADAPIEVVVDALNDAGVQYVLIGGGAMMLHGSAYITEDVDLCYARDRANVERLVTALTPFRPRLRLSTGETVPFRWDAQTVLNGLNFTLTTLVGDVDLLAHVDGLGDYTHVSAHARRYEIGTRTCRCSPSKDSSSRSVPLTG
jgi:hypothetical protein